MPHGRRHRSRNTQPPASPPNALNQSNLRHLCAVCAKPRSSKYHERHPLVLGQTPEPGICSRPECAKLVTTILRESLPQLVIKVYEIHNNYSVNAVQEEPPPTYSNAAERPHCQASLGRENVNAAGQRRQVSLGWEETPPKHAAAELSAESSLAGRAELPGNPTYMAYSTRYSSARLHTIPEESPPPVNYLKKPTTAIMKCFRPFGK